MQKIYLYFPLIGYVLPTVIIGYGIVIPRNGVCGVNELTIGFAGAIVGAALTYLAGIHIALGVGNGGNKFLAAVHNFISRQAAHPSGLFGRLLGWIWPIEHRRLNEQVLELLRLEPGDRVLEMGCGSGLAVALAAKRIGRGFVQGFDISPLMVRMATRRNRRAIARGRAAISLVPPAGPLGDPWTFDKALAVHCLYFWSDPAEELTRLAATLYPDGRLALAFRPEGEDIPPRFRNAIYRFYTREQVGKLLTEAGFRNIQFHPCGKTGKVLCALAERGETKD